MEVKIGHHFGMAGSCSGEGKWSREETGCNKLTSDTTIEAEYFATCPICRERKVVGTLFRIRHKVLGIVL